MYPDSGTPQLKVPTTERLHLACACSHVHSTQTISDKATRQEATLPLTTAAASLVPLPCLAGKQAGHTASSAARIAASRRPLSRPATGFPNSGMLNSSASLLLSSILSHHPSIITSPIFLFLFAGEKLEARRFVSFPLSLSPARHAVQVVHPRSPGCPGLWRSRPGKLSCTVHRSPLELRAPVGTILTPTKRFAFIFGDGLAD